MVIGIEPGNTEVGKGKAFSGPAGKRLFDWLQQAGIGSTREEAQEKIYFTSLLKCKTNKGTDVKDCVSNCIGFLNEQIKIINPKVVITLGDEPIKHLFGKSARLSDLAGDKYHEAEIVPSLFPRFDANTVIVPLPHPSPINARLHNDEYKKRLARSIEHLKGLISE